MSSEVVQEMIDDSIDDLAGVYALQDTSVLNVRAAPYGALGNNSADDTTAIQAALNACPNGGVVSLPVGVYRTSAPLVVPPYVTLRGAYGMRGQASLLNSASDLGSRIRPLPGFTGSAIIRLNDKEIGGYDTDHESAVISDVTLDGSGKTSGSFGGILATGYVHGLRLSNVNISSVRGDGVGTSDYVRTDSSVQWPYSWHMDNIQVWAATNDGFALSKTTDTVAYGCRAIGCGRYGFYLRVMPNSTFTACRSEWSKEYGFYISGNWGAYVGSGGVIFEGTSTDRNGKDGIRIDATGAASIVLASMILRRDGRGTGNPPTGGAWSGLSLNGATMPVVVNGLSVYPGVDDTGIGVNTPRYGVTVSGSTYLSVADGFLHADVAGWNDDGTSTKVLKGAYITERVGTPNSFTTIYPDPYGTAAGCAISRLSTTPSTAASGARNVTGYDSLVRADPGFAANLSTGTITVVNSGWYTIEAHVRLNTGGTNYNVLAVADAGTNVAVVRGGQVLATGSELSASGVAYLAAGTSLVANVYTTDSIALVGSAAGNNIYFRVVKMIAGSQGQNGVPGAPNTTYTAPGPVTLATGATRLYNDTGRMLVITKVRASIGTPPLGSSLIVDVNKGGSTIFTTQANRPAIAASGSTAISVPDITTWNDGEYLTVDIDQIGSGTAGSNLVVQVSTT